MHTKINDKTIARESESNKGKLVPGEIALSLEQLDRLVTRLIVSKRKLEANKASTQCSYTYIIITLRE